MNYKKIISVSFATLLLANTGAPVVANATTSSGAEALDEEVLKDIFDSSTDFNSIKMMNEIKKEQVEEEQPEETEDKKERLDEGTTSNEEVVVDKEVEKPSEEASKESTSDKVANTEVSEEPESITEEDQDSRNEENNTVVQESGIQGEVELVGYWGTCQWAYSSTTEQYTIYSGGGINSMGSDPDSVAPWLRSSSVLLASNPPSSFSVVVQEGVKISGGITFFMDDQANKKAMAAAREKLTEITFAGETSCTFLKTMENMFAYGTALRYVKGLDNLQSKINVSKARLFYRCESLVEVRITSSKWAFHTDDTQVSSMFYGTENLRTLVMDNISYWGNNFSLLNKMSLGSVYSPLLTFVSLQNWKIFFTSAFEDTGQLKSFFSGLKKVKTLTLNKFLSVIGTEEDQAKIDMTGLFTGLIYLEYIDVGGWETPNVTNMSQLFLNLYDLQTIAGLGSWDTSNVTNMSHMFKGCANLKSLHLNTWNTSKVTDMSYMFSGTENLKELYLDNWEFREDVNLYAFIDGGISGGILQTLSMNNIKYNSSDLTELGFIFLGTSKLKVLNAKGWDLPNVTDLSNMGEEVFYRVPVESLDLSDWKIPKVTDMSNAFTGWKTLTTLSLKNWDLSNITDLNNLGEKVFGNIPVKTLDLSGWKTPNVTTMINAFRSWETLTTLSLKDWDTSNVKSMNNMVSYSKSLKDLDISGWDTSSVTDMSYMFSGLSSLTKLDVTHFDTSSVTNMWCMFSEMSSLAELDVTHFDTLKVVRMDSMFSEMSSLTELDVTNFDTSSVTNMSYMFSGLSSLTELDVKNFDTSKVSNMDRMFKNMSNLKKLDMSGFNVSKVTRSSAMFENTDQIESLVMNDWEFGDKSSLVFLKESIFQYTNNLKTLEAKGWNLSNITDLNKLGEKVFGRVPVKTLDLSGWKTPNVTDMEYAFLSWDTLTTLSLKDWDTSNVKSMYQMIYDCKSLKDLDISGWDTSSVTNMSFMFAEMSSLTKLDVTHFDTSSVTDMWRMFYGMSSLTELDVTNFDTSSVTNMSNMFAGMSSLTELDVKNFDTSKVSYMDEMFKNMSNLKKLDMSGFNISKVATSSAMFENTDQIESLVMNDWEFGNKSSLTFLKARIFQYTNNLKTLEAKGWDVSNVTSLDDLYQSVFNAPKQITEMDLSGWKTPNVTTMNNMFAGAENLESINLSGWDTKKVTDMRSVFDGAVSLSNISLAGWNTKDKFVDSSRMFKDVNKLERLTLGDGFRFSLLSALAKPVSSKKESTGYWTREDGNSAAYDPNEFMENFGSGDLTGGVYVAEVNIPYSLSNFKAENTTIGQASIISFDLETNEDLDSNLFTDDVMTFSVTANALPEEIEYESVDVSYVSLANGKLTPITSKRYDKENKTIHFDVTETMLGFTNKIRITVNGTAWNNTTNSKENTSFLVDYNTDETGPVENSYLARKITGQTQVNNGQLSFSAVPEKLEFNPTKLIVTQEDMIIDRLVPDWGIQVSDYRGTNALSTTDKTVARQDWELLATMDAFTDSKGETVSSAALGLVYINERGNKEELSEKEAVVLETHTVENETAKENHETTISWEEEKGLKTVVKNRNALNSNEEYAAQVKYELRVAP
ncbi:BspA family leucine-rich repeat surface protein [Enterococcus faecalis]|nr:BspA family leucine-rich repeat surface protein [Enterococcus faecalis]